MYENRPIEPANKKDLIEIDAIVDGEEKIKENFKIIRHSETIDRKSKQEEVGKSKLQSNEKTEIDVHRKPGAFIENKENAKTEDSKEKNICHFHSKWSY